MNPSRHGGAQARRAFKFRLDAKSNCAYIRELEAESDLRDLSPVAFARSAVTETRASAGFLGRSHARAK
jgi:hypothetical protein